jgi:two-component system response regulator MtrA
MTRRHVLVVEDDPLVSETIAAMLEDGGCDVSQVADGRGLRAFLSSLPTPDLALLDMQLPDEPGSVRLVDLREHGIPVIAMSASSDAVPTVHAAGVPFLAKPFRYNELMLAVAGLSSRRA